MPHPNARPVHRKSVVVQNKSLSNQELRFAEEYLFDLDAQAAAVRAGLSAPEGPRLLAKGAIQYRIALAKRQRMSRTQIYADEALRRWTLLAEAKITEVYDIYVPCCRYCWGIDFRFQFTQNEFSIERLSHQREQQSIWPKDEDAEKREDFDEQGGLGYDRRRRPNTECPECNGLGDPPFAVMKDTRDLGEVGLLLLDGLKVSKDGSVEVKLRDRNWAETMMARHIGLINEKRRLDDLDPGTLTDEQLNAALFSMARRGLIEVPSSDVTDAVIEGEAEEVPAD